MVSKAQQMTQKLHAYLRLEDLKLLFQQWQHLLLEVLCSFQSSAVLHNYNK